MNLKDDAAQLSEIEINSLHAQCSEMFHAFMLAAYFSNTNKVLNDLDLGQGQPFVGPALGPNCLYLLIMQQRTKFAACKERVTDLIK